MIKTFDQLADIVLAARWNGLDTSALRGITAFRLLDFFCVLRFSQRHYEITDQGDAGMVKIASVFPDCLRLDPKIQDRCRTAIIEDDQRFLGEIMGSLCGQSKRSLDKRLLSSLQTKMFLFLNWPLPLLNPELESGLMMLSNSEILELLMCFDPPVEWDDDRLKGELRRLKLTRPKGELKESIALAVKQLRPI